MSWWRVPVISGFECDAFSPRARRMLAYLSRPGTLKKARRAYNKRVRRDGKFAAWEAAYED
jgi:hypothetical protein